MDDMYSTGLPDQDSGSPRPESRTARITIAIDRLADRRFFLPATGLLPVADYALPFLPNQTLMLLLSLLRPERWWSVALVFALASGIGAALIAALIQFVGAGLLDHIVDGRPDAAALTETRRLIGTYGLFALFFVAMLPWPPRLTVIIFALVGLSPWSIGLAVGAGRLLPCAIYCAIGAFAPHLLRRNHRIETLFQAVLTARHREGRVDVR